MRQIVSLSLVSPLFIAATFAQADRSPVNVKDIVEIERLTHTEVSEKIQKEGKTSVLIITGGTEERGPHAVLGGHTIMSRHRGVEIAKRLGNALLAPVLPRSLWPVRRWLAYAYLVHLVRRSRAEGGGPLIAPYLALHDLVELAAVARGAARYRTFVL